MRKLRSLIETAEAAEISTVAGKDGWLFFVPELRHLAAGRFWGDAAAAVSRATDPEAVDPLPAILDFKEQLDRVGVELLFVPVPAKAAIYPDRLLDAPDAAIGQADRDFLEVLAARGVPVLDLAPSFRDAAEEEDLYCRQDTHWSPRGLMLAARRIVEEVSGRPWLRDTPRVETVAEERTIEIEGDLRRGLPDPKPEKERLPIVLVGRRTAAGLEPLAPWRQSPVLLLGDSHTLVFHAGAELHATGAGLADHLAKELGFAVDLVGVRGSGATPARINLLRRRDNLAGKKLVIWCLSVREYTQGQGWKKVPVVR